MAEYDNVQLHSNYQTNHKYNNNDNGLTLKRRKNNYRSDSKTVTVLKCQRPKSAVTCGDDEHRTKTSTMASSVNLETIVNRLIINCDSNDKCCTLSPLSKTTTNTTTASTTYCIDNNHNNNYDNKFYRLPIRKSHFSCYNKSFTLALLLMLGLLFKTTSCEGFQLEGTENSYAQFRKWYSGLNGTLELEFKTEQPNGLVLYTDDGGTYDFFELKLVEGALRLRYNLGGGAQIITVGRDLHDGHWHKVQVSYCN
jgi:hypothetical protein